MNAPSPGIPRLVVEKVARFLADGRTGNITLDIKTGRVLGYKITECGRIGDDSVGAPLPERTPSDEHVARKG